MLPALNNCCLPSRTNKVVNIYVTLLPCGLLNGVLVNWVGLVNSMGLDKWLVVVKHNYFEILDIMPLQIELANH